MIEDYVHEKLAFVSDPTVLQVLQLTTTEYYKYYNLLQVGLLIKGFIYQNEQAHSLQSCKI